VVTNETDVPTGNAPQSADKIRKPDRKRLLLVLAVVVAAAVVLFLANRDEPAPAAKDDSVEMFSIEDRDDGFAIDLPGNWVFLEQERVDPQIRMVVGEQGTQNNLRVRVSPLPQPVVVNDDTPDTVVAQLQGQFDQYINTGENVRDVMQRSRVKINGVHGWWYLYSFNNAGGEEEGVHSHFFMLGGDKLYTLVFQVLPASGYPKYAATFDKMISSFEILNPGSAASPEASPAG
jgi:hypothetical protein